MHNYILFALYLLVVLLLLGFVVIFLMHIREYKQYSRYIGIVTKTYIIIVLTIAIIGGYFVLTGSIIPSQGRSIQRINL